MSVTAKPRNKLMGRLVASIQKADAANIATNDSSAEAPHGPEGLSKRPTVTPQELRQMAAIKRFPNENVEETRQAHIRYLENKKEEFTKLLKTLEKDKNKLTADEAELVYWQWWSVQRKETLTRDFEDILKEEREAMHAQAKKKPQEIEAARNGGEPNLQTRIDLLDEAKRKVLVSLREVEDEELGNVDTGKQLRAKREELTRRAKEGQEKLASVEETLLQLNQAMKDQESLPTVSKEQLAVPPVEHDGSTRKRTTPQACEESQPKKANIPYGLEDEEPEEEEEEHVSQREEPGREKKMVATNERGSARKSMRIPLNRNGPVQAEEVSREKEVNAREPPAAAAHATQQSSTSTPSATRGDRQPPSAGTRISLDELEQAVANTEFRRDEERKICIACPYCDRKEDSVCLSAICTHFVTHLRTEDRPYRCSQAECHRTSIQVQDMRRHFEGRHKELAWNDEIAKECEVAPNVERLNAIKRLMGERTGRFREKLSLEELEEQAKTSTFERDPEGGYLFHCSICELPLKVTCGRPLHVRHHLITHLAHESLPFPCPARDCDHATGRLQCLKEHFLLAHKELEWTAEMEKASAVTEHVKRFEAIVHGLAAVVRGLSFDDLKARTGNCTFTRDAKGILRMKCSLCAEQIKVVKRANIQLHLMSHLRQSCLPLRCLEDGCQYMTSRVPHLRTHFQLSHEGKELSKEAEKDCEMIDNKKRLDAIVADLYDRRPRGNS